MKIAYVQIAGGIGAQIIGALAVKSLEKKGYFVFKDGRYFSKKGKKLIPENITFFEKEISNDILKFNLYEKSNLVVWAIKYFFKFVNFISPNLIKFFEEFPVNKRKCSEAKNFLDSQEGKEIINKILIELDINCDGSNDNSICIHLRRGDFLSAGLETLSLRSAINEVKKFTSKIENFLITVITDSPELIKEELKNLDFNCEIQSSSLKEDLKKMIKSNYFVASNSQLSLISIWLSKNISKISCPEDFKELVPQKSANKIFWR